MAEAVDQAVSHDRRAGLCPVTQQYGFGRNVQDGSGVVSDAVIRPQGVGVGAGFGGGWGRANRRRAAGGTEGGPRCVLMTN